MFFPLCSPKLPLSARNIGFPIFSPPRMFTAHEENIHQFFSSLCLAVVEVAFTAVSPLDPILRS